VQLAEQGRDRVLVGQVLEEVGDPYAVEVVLGQVGVHDVGDDHLDAVGLEVGLLDHVDGPALARRDGADELPAASRGVEHALRGAHPVVHVLGDLAPHG
jgi:hypothetical protein